MTTLWLGSLKGVSFEPFTSNIQNVYAYAAGTRVKIILTRDMANRFDPYAICVYFNYQAVGYIPRSANKQILEYGLANLTASFIGFNLFDGRVVGASIKIEKKKLATKPIKPERHLRLVQKLTNTPRKIMV